MVEYDVTPREQGSECVYQANCQYYKYHIYCNECRYYTEFEDIIDYDDEE